MKYKWIEKFQRVSWEPDKIGVLLILSVCISVVGFSQIDQSKHHLDEVYEECIRRLHGDSGALKCAIEVSEEWDKEIRKYYIGLLNVLDSSAQNDLELTQEQWLIYRDLEYKFSGSLHAMDGTMYSRMRAFRNMNIVRTRALELKSYYWTRTEEEEPKSTQFNGEDITEHEPISASILPTPDSEFLNSLDDSRRIDAEYMIDKYLETYFFIVEPEKVIRKTEIDNPEYPDGPVDCGFRTVYNNNLIIEDDFGCDSYTRSTIIEFGNYSFKEVSRVIKILLPKVYKSGYYEDQDGWHDLESDDEWYGYSGSCSLSIYSRDNQTFVDYGCG